MSHWSTIVSNFADFMASPIAGLDTRGPLEQTEDLVDLTSLPETVVGERYALQCLGIIDSASEVNTVYTTTFRVRLQLSFFAADRAAYDVAIANFEAVIRARLNIGTFNAVFDRLVLQTSQFATGKGVVAGNVDFAVTLRGS